MQYVSRHFNSNHQFIYLQRTAQVISVTKSSLNERNILKIKFTVKDPFKVLNLMSFCLHQNVIKYRYKYKYKSYFIWIITFNMIELIDIYIFSIEICILINVTVETLNISLCDDIYLLIFRTLHFIIILKSVLIVLL